MDDYYAEKELFKKKSRKLTREISSKKIVQKFSGIVPFDYKLQIPKNVQKTKPK